jgi:hypothetical protein
MRLSAGSWSWGVAFIEDAFSVDACRRTQPAGCLRQSISLRSVRVLLLDGIERVVDELAGGGDLVGRLLPVGDLDLGAGRQLGAILQRLPPGERRHPEDVLLDVVVALFQLGADGFKVFCADFTAVVRGIEEVVALRIAELRFNLPLPHGEGLGDVFQEDEAEDRVLIDGGVEIGPEAISGRPELFVEVAEELLGGIRH